MFFGLETISIATATAVDEKMAMPGEAVKIPHVLVVLARSAVRGLQAEVLVVVFIASQTVTQSYKA